MDDNVIKISIRNLIEFVLRSGSIDNRFVGSSRAIERAIEGTKLHQKIQRAGGEGYTPEVLVKYKKEYKDFSFIIEGRVGITPLKVSGGVARKG